jgi:phosphoesterase RecJ-like protein
MKNKNSESQIKTLIEESSSCVIIPHKNPDGDALGSCLALNHFLLKKGLNSIVISPNDYPSFLKWMPGETKILNFEKESTKAVQKIENADLIFTLDFNDLSRSGIMCDNIKVANGKIIMIDHHEKPKEYADLKLSDPEIGSTCEMIYNLINYIDSGIINSDIASCLYTGIMTDTGSFRFPSTTSGTHHVIAKLIEKGANNSEIHQKIYDTFSFNRLKLLGVALKNIQKLDSLPYIIITLNQTELDECSFKKGDTEGFVNYGLSIKGIELSVILIESKEDGIIKMSFRSKGDFSVNIFAEKYFCGGGHHNAAGGVSKEAMYETKNRLINLLKSFH